MIGSGHPIPSGPSTRILEPAAGRIKPEPRKSLQNKDLSFHDWSGMAVAPWSPEPETGATTMQKTDYLESTTGQLELWRRWFEGLESRLEQVEGEARDALDRRLTVARQCRRRLDRRVREARRSAREDWSRVRDDLEEAVTDFRGLALDLFDRSRGVEV
jgi:hypothetical protein